MIQFYFFKFEESLNVKKSSKFENKQKFYY